MSLPMASLTAASVQDRDGATDLLGRLGHKFWRLRLMWADQADAGDLLSWLWALRPWRVVSHGLMTER